MELLSVPRFILSAVGSGVGKSLIGLGLAFNFRKRNIGVSCCVCGPNLPQSILYRRLSGRYVRTLDEKILTRGQIMSTLQHAGFGADIVLIEGREGLYDGFSPGNTRGSDSELASFTKSPTFIVIDARNLGNGLAAILKGHLELAKGFDLAGAIANRVSTSEDADSKDKVFYDTSLQSFGLPPLVGAVPEIKGEVPMPRGDFSQSRNMASIPRQFLVDVGNLVADHIDIDSLVVKANNVQSVRYEDVSSQPFGRRCKIAVSDDLCFNVGFQDNIDLLKFFGAEVTTFSPLADLDLPKKVGAVYLTGGFISDYASEVANNDKIKGAIRDFVDQGGVVFAEGGGAAYLCQEFQFPDKGERYEGVGILPGVAIYSGQSKLSYTESVTVEDSILGRQGLILKGIDTAEWNFKTPIQVVRALRTAIGSQSPFQEGYSPGAQVIVTSTFTHWGSNPIIAKNLVDAAEVVQRI